MFNYWCWISQYWYWQIPKTRSCIGIKSQKARSVHPYIWNLHSSLLIFIIILVQEAEDKDVAKFLTLANDGREEKPQF